MDYEAKKVFLVNSTFIIFTGAIIYFVAKFMLAYLLPFLIGVILAFLVQKPARYISIKFKIKTGICAAVLVLITYSVIFATGALVITKLIVEAGSFFNQLPEYFSGVYEYFSRIYKDLYDNLKKLPNDSYETVTSILENTVTNITVSVTGFFSSAAAQTARSAPAFAISSIVTVVASCYIAKDFELIIKFFKNFLRSGTYNTAIKIKNILTESILKFSLGYLLLMGITFVELLIGLLILRIKYAPIVAVIIALIDILPVLGTGTVIIPWSLVEIATGNTGLGVGLIILYLFITFVRNFLEPRVIGKQMGINPLITLITMFVGLKLLGIIGMILLPIIFIVIVNYYKSQMSEESKISEE